MQVTLDEAQKCLSDLFNAAISGDEIIIVKEGEQAVQLVPVKTLRQRPQFGSAKGKIWISDDFDEPLEDFREYME